MMAQDWANYNDGVRIFGQAAAQQWWSANIASNDSVRCVSCSTANPKKPSVMCGKRRGDRGPNGLLCASYCGNAQANAESVSKCE
jgi:hypothetical protein